MHYTQLFEHVHLFDWIRADMLNTWGVNKYMSKSAMMLKWLLLIGAVYFLAVAVVHMLRTKVPLLFVYYNAPSYGYQDRIISFLSFGWSVFMFMASLDPTKNRDAVKAIIVAGFGAIFGLTVINAVTDFRALSPNIDPSVFRIEALGLSVYVVALIYCYFISTKQNANESK